MTVTEIKAGLKAARVPDANKMNVSDVLNQAGHFVDRSTGEDSKSVWHLTESGRTHVRKLHGLPEKDAEIEHDVTTLRTTISKVTDSDVREYLEEGLKCLEVGALRATIVFIWTAAIRTVQTNLLQHKLADVTTAVQKHDPKARPIKTLEDFSYIKDSITLLAAKELADLDKSEKEILEEALDLRNKCGHPVKYSPGVKKVSSFIEDVVSILFV